MPPDEQRGPEVTLRIRQKPEDWHGPCQTRLTLRKASALFKTAGGFRENRRPPAYITCEYNDDGSPGNVASVYAEDHGHLGDVAYRPHEAHVWGPDGLFLC